MIDYITKSMIFSYEFCPVQFYKSYILRERRPQTPQMAMGTRFHEFAEWFFGQCPNVDIANWDHMVPPSFNSKERGMAQYLIDHERDRYKLLGAEAFTPYGCEVWCQSERLKIRGYIDRVDWVNKDDGIVRLVEYKTGMRAKIPQVKQELAFYSIMFNDVTDNKYDVQQLGIYYPALRCYKEYPLQRRDINAVTKKWDKLKKAIETNTFVEKCNDYKRQSCGLCRSE